jgi:hypothetical protein
VDIDRELGLWRTRLSDIVDLHARCHAGTLFVSVSPPDHLGTGKRTFGWSAVVSKDGTNHALSKRFIIFDDGGVVDASDASVVIAHDAVSLVHAVWGSLDVFVWSVGAKSDIPPI